MKASRKRGLRGTVVSPARCRLQVEKNAQARPCLSRAEHARLILRMELLESGNARLCELLASSERENQSAQLHGTYVQAPAEPADSLTMHTLIGWRVAAAGEIA